MKRLAVTLAVLLSLVIVHAARADEPIVLKFSHVVAPDAAEAPDHISPWPADLCVLRKRSPESLVGDKRAQLDRAVKESSDFFNAAAAKDNDDAIEKIRASGKTEIHILTEAEKKAWISKLMPVHTEMQSRFGKDFIERIYKASGFTPPQS